MDAYSKNMAWLKNETDHFQVLDLDQNMQYLKQDLLSCPEGRFGAPLCIGVCHCKNNVKCTELDGCPGVDDCQDGWRGVFCSVALFEPPAEFDAFEIALIVIFGVLPLLVMSGLIWYIRRFERGCMHTIPIIFEDCSDSDDSFNPMSESNF